MWHYHHQQPVNPIAPNKTLYIKSMTWLHKSLSAQSDFWLPMRHLKGFSDLRDDALSHKLYILLLFAGSTASTTLPPLQWSYQHGGLQHPRQEDSHRGLQWPDKADSRWESFVEVWILLTACFFCCYLYPILIDINRLSLLLILLVSRAWPGPRRGAWRQSWSSPDPRSAGAGCL